jgi:hypothetical protein
MSKPSHFVSISDEVCATCVFCKQLVQTGDVYHHCILHDFKIDGEAMDEQCYCRCDNWMED